MAEHLDADEIFEITKQGFDYYIEQFAPAVPVREVRPDLRAGVQHRRDGERRLRDRRRGLHASDRRRPTPTTRRRAETLLHELAHMWFGDLVTMRWWDDLWLKESFATYVSVRVPGRGDPLDRRVDRVRQRRQGLGLRQDELPSTHPIVADIRDLDDVAVNFDGITYAKGAAVLKQLVAWVGDGRVLRRRPALLRRRTRGATPRSPTCSARWRRRPAGTCPRGRASGCRRPARTRCARRSRSTTTAGSRRSRCASRRRRSTRRCGRTGSRSGSTAASTAPWCAPRRHELDVVGADHRRCPTLVGVARPDLVLLNDDDLTYAKIRLDDASLATLRDAHRRVHRLAAPRAVLGARPGT